MGFPNIFNDGGRNAPLIEYEEPRASGAERLNFQALNTTLQRRFWLYMAVSATIFVLAAVFTVLQTPTFTASARVMIDVQPVEIAPQRANIPVQTSPDDAKIQTEVALLRSRDLTAQVVDALKLDQDPEFAGGDDPAARPDWKAKLKAFIRRAPLPLPAAATEAAAQRRDAVIDNVLSGLSVTRVEESHALDLTYQAGAGRKASAIANAYAQVYTRYKLAAKVGDNQQASSLLNSRIEALRTQAEADTRAVQQYRIENNLLTTSGASLTEQEISDYNQAVTVAKAQAAEDQARLNTARGQLRSGSLGDDVGEALGSVVVQNLRTKRIEISGRVADLQGRYGDRHPDLLKAKRELVDVDTQITQEIQRVISNLEAKARVSRERLQSLQSSLSGARSNLQQNNRAMVDLSELEQRAATSKTLYETYLERVKETAAQEGTQRSDVRIISAARTPLWPSSPKVFLNMGLGGVLGVSLGLAAAILAEMASSCLTTAEDVEQRLNRPYLGSIPLLASVENAGQSPTRSIVDHPRSGYAEAFRSLRTSIAYAAAGPVQVVAVISALPQEGKTTTSLGLAQSAAIEGKRVLLVDCDIRRRTLNKMVGGSDRKVGLLEVLAGEAPFTDAVVQDEASGVFILGVNDSEKLSPELLTGEEMDRFLAQARKRFNLIVLDAAPVLPVAETRVLATKADATVFVARWRKTPEHAILAAFRMLPKDKARISGVALTQVDMRLQQKYGFGDPGYYYKQYKDYYR